VRYLKNALAISLLGSLFALAPVATQIASAGGTCGNAGVMTSTATSVTCTYSYTGSEDTYTTPVGISTLSVSVYGAQGGGVKNQSGNTVAGGKGAEATATLSGVTSLNIFVGQVGSVSAGGSNPSGDYFGGSGGSTGSTLDGHAGGGGAGSAVNFTGGLIVAAGGGGTGSDAPGSDGYGPSPGGGGGDSTSGGNGGNGGEACCEENNENFLVNGGGQGTGASSSTFGSGGSAGTVSTSLGTDQAGSNGSNGFVYVSSGDGGDGAGGPNSGGDGGGGDGGGGGGGYNGGGGGGSGADTVGGGLQAGSAGGGGGGGVSYASDTASPSFTAAAQSGNGQIKVTYFLANITTTPSLTAVTLGSSPTTLNDTATLAGGITPTGTITFTLYNPASTLVDTETATVSGDGNYSTPTGYTLPTTGTVTGTYQWDATYNGDTSNAAFSDNNNSNEQVVVSPASPSLSTTPNPTAVTLSSSSTTLNDSATLSGGATPTGTITFTLYLGATLLDTETVSVAAGNSTYTTPTGYTLPTTGTVTGTYQWDASYNGDNNNASVADNNAVNEQVVVSPASPTLSTTPNPTLVSVGATPTLKDSALLSGSNPTGTITFTLYDGATLLDTETVSVAAGNGTYTTPTGYTLGSGAVNGTIYQWDAQYDGDTNNASVADNNAVNEQVMVGKIPQVILFTAPASGFVGGSAPLSATGGASGNPVVFSVDPTSGPGVCSVSGTNGTTVHYTAPGNCVIDANQAGNTTYSAADQVQRSIPVGKAPTTLITSSRATQWQVLNGLISFQATLTSQVTGQAIAGQTITFTLSGEGDTSCTATTNSRGVATCDVVGPLFVFVRIHSFTATYRGSADYQASSATGAVNFR
jgi:hypothetical protein